MTITLTIEGQSQGKIESHIDDVWPGRDVEQSKEDWLKIVLIRFIRENIKDTEKKKHEVEEIDIT